VRYFSACYRGHSVPLERDRKETRKTFAAGRKKTRDTDSVINHSDSFAPNGTRFRACKIGNEPRCEQYRLNLSQVTRGWGSLRSENQLRRKEDSTRETKGEEEVSVLLESEQIASRHSSLPFLIFLSTPSSHSCLLALFFPLVSRSPRCLFRAQRVGNSGIGDPRTRRGTRRDIR